MLIEWAPQRDDARTEPFFSKKMAYHERRMFCDILAE